MAHGGTDDAVRDNRPFPGSAGGPVRSAALIRVSASQPPARDGPTSPGIAHVIHTTPMDVAATAQDRKRIVVSRWIVGHRTETALNRDCDQSALAGRAPLR